MDCFKRLLILTGVFLSGANFAAQLRPSKSISLTAEDMRTVAASGLFIGRNTVYGAVTSTLGYVGYKSAQSTYGVDLSREELKLAIAAGAVIGFAYSIFSLPRFIENRRLQQEQDQQRERDAQELIGLRQEKNNFAGIQNQLSRLNEQAEQRAAALQQQVAALQSIAQEAQVRVERIEQAGKTLIHHQVWGVNLSLGTLGASVASLELQINMARHMQLPVSHEQQAALDLGNKILSAGKQLGIASATNFSVNSSELQNALGAPAQ